MNETRPNPDRIKRIAESIISLPTLPTVVSKMIELVDNPKTSAGSLARLISADQVLTARILKLANSAYYGLSREVSTVDMAIVVLGFNAVRDMGLSLSVLDTLKGAGSAQSLDNVKFWEHSVGCGIGCRMLARTYCRRIAGESFVAGLLHDIGKLVVNQYASREFEQVLALVGDGLSFDGAEDTVLGVRHAQVGSWLGEKWRLPPGIVEGIRLHHTPHESSDSALPALVCLSDLLCHLTSTGHSGRITPADPGDDLWENLQLLGIGVGPEALDDLQTQFLLEFDQSEAFISFLYE